jgi:uncharacterized membrane protein YwzB
VIIIQDFLCFYSKSVTVAGRKKIGPILIKGRNELLKCKRKFWALYSTNFQNYIFTTDKDNRILFYVSLSVLLSITLANDQLDEQNLNTFITVLYTYLFRAISCSSSEGQTVLTL